MKGVTPTQHRLKPLPAALSFILLLALLSPGLVVSQTGDAGRPEAAPTPSPALAADRMPLFRLETTPVGGDAELLTIHGSLNGRGGTDARNVDVPLVSILRDTLGDESPENDRLRYVWMHTYTRPGLLQRTASAIPSSTARPEAGSAPVRIKRLLT